MSTANPFDSLAEWISRTYGDGITPVEVVVTVLTVHGPKEIRMPFPQVLPSCQSPMQETVVDLPVASNNGNGDCRADIIQVLEDNGDRMTTNQILASLEKTEKLWGESTIKMHLSQMVAAGKLTQEPKAKPRGYGLPEWED